MLDEGLLSSVMGPHKHLATFVDMDCWDSLKFGVCHLEGGKVVIGTHIHLLERIMTVPAEPSRSGRCSTFGQVVLSQIGIGRGLENNGNTLSNRSTAEPRENAPEVKLTNA